MALQNDRQSSGMSRRELIRNAGIAGAAAWTAPMLIDSVSSAAFATVGSGGTGSVVCSKSLIFYTRASNPGTVYVTGYQNSCLGCGCFGNFANEGFFSCPGWKFDVAGGNNGTNALAATSCAGPFVAATPVTTASSPSCNSDLSINSATGTISANAGVTLIGAAAFEASVTRSFCPNGLGNIVVGTDCKTGGGTLTATCV